MILDCPDKCEATSHVHQHAHNVFSEPLADITCSRNHSLRTQTSSTLRKQNVVLLYLHLNRLLPAFRTRAPLKASPNLRGATAEAAKTGQTELRQSGNKH